MAENVDNDGKVSWFSIDPRLFHKSISLKLGSLSLDKSHLSNGGASIDLTSILDPTLEFDQRIETLGELLLAIQSPFVNSVAWQNKIQPNFKTFQY